MTTPITTTQTPTRHSLPHYVETTHYVAITCGHANVERGHPPSTPYYGVSSGALGTRKRTQIRIARQCRRPCCSPWEGSRRQRGTKTSRGTEKGTERERATERGRERERQTERHQRNIQTYRSLKCKDSLHDSLARFYYGYQVVYNRHPSLQSLRCMGLQQARLPRYAKRQPSKHLIFKSPVQPILHMIV